MSKISHTPLEVLKRHWGYDHFRTNQEAIINYILESKDTIVLMPTGGGKSLCFQVPALIKEGTCLVISPLIALINDQIQKLKSLDIPSEGLHSGLEIEKQNKIVDSFIAGRLKLLYISPEKLQSKKFRNILQKANISFIAIDEAHCISQWGYDFRPEYKMISNVKEILPEVQICAFTATANKKTLQDIKKYLALNEPKTITGSFFKKNIEFGVINTEKRIAVLLLLIRQLQGSGIIYMRSRLGTEKLVRILRNNNIEAGYYHAGMDSKQREKAQEEWLANKFEIIVSTTAFGMGIDKPDVRFVIHYDLPTSMEEYYQEAGRAGRDGKLSHAVIIYNENSVNNLRKRNIEEFPTIKEIQRTYLNIKKFISDSETDKFDIDKFVTINGISRQKTLNGINEMEREKLIALNQSIKDSRSKIKFLVSEDKIEELKNDDPLAFDVCKAMILMYSGIMNFHTPISEQNIASKLEIDTDIVVRTIMRLNAEKILDYLQNIEDLVITINDKKTYKSIDKENIRYRKKRAALNLKAISQYLNYHKCRQRNILNYFNEKLGEKCKICDICYGTFDNRYSKVRFESYKKQVLSLDFREGRAIDDLMFLNGYMDRFKNLEMLKKLIKSGTLKIVGSSVVKN